MRKTLFLFLLWYIPISIISQQINHFAICSSGNQFRQENVQFDWTLGEVSSETLSNNGLMLYQGFQQKLDEIKTGLIQRNLSGILLYPNPVFNKFTLNFPGFNSDKVNCIISDLNGRIILSKSLNNISTEFDISFLSPGLYILKIYSENSNFNFTQKIIKK